MRSGAVLGVYVAWRRRGSACGLVMDVCGVSGCQAVSGALHVEWGQACMCGAPDAQESWSDATHQPGPLFPAQRAIMITITIRISPAPSGCSPGEWGDSGTFFQSSMGTLL